MNSLDSIWDEPAVVVEARDQKSAQRSLFLSDSEDENDNVRQKRRFRRAGKPADIDVDIDAMFADVENDEDDPFTFKPIGALDTEALRREAEARHKDRLPSYTPHAILPTSSPPRDGGEGGGTTAKDRGGEKKDGEKKARKRPVRLDEGRLLSPTGFPQLIKDTKGFRIKGKGHEVTDLNRLLQIYQFWTHRMYPKTQFRDTVERVEKLCHSKRMNVSLSVWRDESHGRAPDNKESDDEVVDLTEGSSAMDGNQGFTLNSDGADYASSSSFPPSRPPSTDLEPEDDNFDIDVIIEGERQKIGGAEGSQVANAARGGAINKRHPEQDTDSGAEDFGDDMWNELDLLERSNRKTIPAPKNVAGDADEMWDELDALHAAGNGAIDSRTACPKNPQPDEDQDMWDIVNEIESAVPLKNSTAATTTTGYENDDMDDIYT